MNAHTAYLRDPRRLADLIAAIQVLGTYKFSSRTAEKWGKRLGRVPVSAENWTDIFQEHPEFFTLDDQSLVSLVWRRNKERNYDTQSRRILEFTEAQAIEIEDPEATAKRLSRAPLNTDEISKLVDIAIDLHEREIKHLQERRWWYTAVIGGTGALVTLISNIYH